MPQTAAAPKSIPLELVDRDIVDRFTKRTGKFSTFLADWIKFEDNSDRLYRAIGRQGENYLQYRLARQDVREALIVLEVAKAHWEAGAPERVYGLLSHEDGDGNGIWHYLADSLRQNEGAETMKMAHILLSLDVDFSRRNKHGVSPLGKMLTPSPKWQSLNALVQTKHLSIENIEAAISEKAGDEATRNQMMSLIFRGDLDANRGLLSQHVLKQAMAPSADPTLRAATCRLFFDYCDPEDGATAFFTLITVTNHGMFEDLLHLLIAHTNDAVKAMAPPDAATAKAFRQAYICRKLLRRDGRREGILFKGLAAGKMAHLRKMTALMINDDLAVKKLVRGEPVRQPVVIDRDSPAPANPLLSLLLQYDSDGNTIFHRAILAGESSALEGFFVGLPSNDIHAILTRVTNACGLAPIDLTAPDRARAKIVAAVKSGRVGKAAAQTQMTGVTAVPAEIAAYLKTKLGEIEGLAADTSMRGLPPPNFDLKKVGGSHKVAA